MPGAGILYLDPEARRSFRRAVFRAHACGDAADLGELDRVVDEVEQNLAQARRVAANEFRYILRNIACGSGRFFSLARAPHQHGDRADEALQIEIDAFQHQLPGFDLRKNPARR